MVDRRSFVGATLLTACGAAAGNFLSLCAEETKEEDVSPPEDLMREHGVLNRILLVYDHASAEISAGKSFRFDALHNAATILKSFIENYHEKQEEDYLFPRFQKAGKLVELVHTLKSQHEVGRTLTGQILALSAAKSLNADERQRLLAALHSFNRMYRPHEAREDTILFPALRTIVSKHEFDALGEAFEKREHELFGKEGFESTVAKIAEIEKQLGIYDLAQFTPRASS